jgi:hypothetical protein
MSERTLQTLHLYLDSASQTFRCMLQDRVVVPSPYADAIVLPSRKSIDAAIAAQKLQRSVSTASSVDSADSASQIQNYISTHYNVRAHSKASAVLVTCTPTCTPEGTEVCRRHMIVAATRPLAPSCRLATILCCVLSSFRRAR